MHRFCSTLCHDFFSKHLRQFDENEKATLRVVRIVSSSILELILRHFEIFSSAIIFRIVSVFSSQYFIQTQPVNQAADRAGDQMILRFAGKLEIHGTAFSGRTMEPLYNWALIKCCALFLGIPKPD